MFRLKMRHCSVSPQRSNLKSGIAPSLDVQGVISGITFCLPENKRSIMSAESERIRHCVLYIGASAFIWNNIQITFRIRNTIIYRSGNKSVFSAQIRTILLQPLPRRRADVRSSTSYCLRQDLRHALRKHCESHGFRTNHSSL